MHRLPSLPQASLALFMLFGSGCLERPPTGSEAEAAQSTATSAVAASGTLHLVREKKISQIIPLSGVTDYEASGVQLHDNQLYIVFDDMTKIGHVALDLASGSYASGGSSSTNSQYEGITFDDHTTPHFYVAVEQSPAEVVQYDDVASSGSASHQSTNVTFSASNKGFEGLAWLFRNNNDVLLGLCEGFDCTSSHGGSGGRGGIRVMAQSGSSWTADPTILRLPAAVSFKDYSDSGAPPQRRRHLQGGRDLARVQGAVDWPAERHELELPRRRDHLPDAVERLLQRRGRHLPEREPRGPGVRHE